MTTWTTQDGRTLEVRWMQSQHLVHSINLVMRKNNIGFRQLKSIGILKSKVWPMVEELDARGLYHEGKDNLVKIPPYRETAKELCMLRALIDTFNNPGPAIENFRQNPERYIKSVITRADENEWNRKVAVKFTEYRLAYGGP